jgi:hypothetical protein
METKCCSRCNEIKDCEKFIKKRNICKECSNKWAKLARDKSYKLSLLNNETKICKKCLMEHPLSNLIKNRYLCKDCNNKNYRDNYKNNIEFRNKVILKDKNRNRTVANETQRKRYNDNPINRFIRIQRSRITIALKNKQKNTIEYLGCNNEQYFNWLKYNFNEQYNFENYGDIWHIDHVIPIHTFNMNDEQQQLLALNWRNTMPLSCEENLKKGINIHILQIEKHYKNLVEYHRENNLDLPQVYIDLFAKYLDDGKPLKLSLPLADGNIGKGTQLIADPNGKKVINDY